MKHWLRTSLLILVLTTLSACTGIFGDFTNSLDPGTEYQAMVVQSVYGTVYVNGITEGKGIHFTNSVYEAGTTSSTGLSGSNAYEINRNGKPYVVIYDQKFATPNGSGWDPNGDSDYVAPIVVATDGKIYAKVGRSTNNEFSSYDLTVNDVVYANVPGSNNVTDPDYFTHSFFDPNGTFFVLFPGTGTIKSVSPAGVTTTFAGSGTRSETAGLGDGAAATATSLGFIPWMTLSPSGELYFLECTATISGSGTSAYFSTSEPNFLRKIDTNGVLSTLMGKGTLAAVYEGNGQPATSSKSTWVDVPVFDTKGQAVFCTQGCVARINSDGTFVVLAGSPVARNDFENYRKTWKAAGDLRLGGAGGLTYDPALDILYVVDTLWNTDPTKEQWRILALYKGTLPTVTP